MLAGSLFGLSIEELEARLAAIAQPNEVPDFQRFKLKIVTKRNVVCPEGVRPHWLGRAGGAAASVFGWMQR